jgi:hypothetical protein
MAPYRRVVATRPRRQQTFESCASHRTVMERCAYRVETTGTCRWRASSPSAGSRALRCIRVGACAWTERFIPEARGSGWERSDEISHGTPEADSNGLACPPTSRAVAERPPRPRVGNAPSGYPRSFLAGQRTKKAGEHAAPLTAFRPLHFIISAERAVVKAQVIADARAGHRTHEVRQ